MHASFSNLLSPLKVRNVTFRNRMVKPATTLGFAEHDGTAGPMITEFYETIARGGVGLIIVESSCVDFPVGGKGENRLLVDNDRFIPSFTRLAEAIHKHGCPTFLQVTHNGPAGAFSGIPPLVPSLLSPEDNPEADPRMQYESPREMTLADIEMVVEKHARAAWRAKQAGFDGVEFHGCAAYLLNSFLSRAWNHRQDDYGCQSLENRARIVTDIIRAARSLVGEDFVLGVRINGIELGHPKGTTAAEAAGIARILQDAGLDIISVASWGYGKGEYGWAQYSENFHFPELTVPPELVKHPGFVPSQAANIKSAVTIPVIGLGNIDPSLGEWLVANGKADAIAMGRRLLADPDLPRKVIEGRLEDIRHCMHGLECRSEFKKFTPNHCRVNAALGKEREFKIIPVMRKKRIVVVGGGPSGMEAARIAASRGHEVILYDKNTRLGGSLNIAALVKDKRVEDVPALVHYFEAQLRKLNVQLRLNQEFDLAEARRVKPDAVISAVGGKAVIPDIPGINQSNVITGEALMRKAMPFINLFGPDAIIQLSRLWLPLGRRVLIIGGQLHGAQLAAFLVKRGRRITMVDESDHLGDGISIVYKQRLLDWLEGRGSALLRQTRVTEISGKRATLESRDGVQKTVEFDTAIVVLPTVPNPELADLLRKEVSEVHSIGDGLEPRLILGAIASGAKVGNSI